MTSRQDITGLLLSFMDIMRRDIQSGLPESSSFMHIKALDFIAKQNQPSMSEIAEFLKITSPGATMIVERLVGNGELDRHADPADRRLVRLSITAKGRATKGAGIKIIQKHIAKRVLVLSHAEQKQFSEILNKLITI